MLPKIGLLRRELTWPAGAPGTAELRLTAASMAADCQDENVVMDPVRPVVMPRVTGHDLRPRQASSQPAVHA